MYDKNVNVARINKHPLKFQNFFFALCIYTICMMIIDVMAVHRFNSLCISLKSKKKLKLCRAYYAKKYSFLHCFISFLQAMPKSVLFCTIFHNFVILCRKLYFSSLVFLLALAILCNKVYFSALLLNFAAYYAEKCTFLSHTLCRKVCFSALFFITL